MHYSNYGGNNGRAIIGMTGESKQSLGTQFSDHIDKYRDVALWEFFIINWEGLYTRKKKMFSSSVKLGDVFKPLDPIKIVYSHYSKNHNSVSGRKPFFCREKVYYRLCENVMEWRCNWLLMYMFVIRHVCNWYEI